MAYTIGVYFFFFFNGSEGWEVQDQGVSQFGFQVRALFLAGKLCLSIYPHTAETERGSKLSSDANNGINSTPDSSTLLTSFNANYLPKAPPPHTITLGHWLSTYKTRGGQNIQSTIIKYTVYTELLAVA